MNGSNFNSMGMIENSMNQMMDMWRFTVNSLSVVQDQMENGTRTVRPVSSSTTWSTISPEVLIITNHSYRKRWRCLWAKPMPSRPVVRLSSQAGND